ncbi:MAG TPA: hypothetical protein VNU46_01410 [Gemmatimonadaceae bacterium]|jgi:hypothetical protein|nr:hypothetical protein [Gemmatimonadaceae bacterium]
MTLSRLRAFLPLVFPLPLLATTVSCRQRADSSTDPYTAMATQVMPSIERAVGLKYKHPPKVETRSKSQVRQFVLKQVTDPHAQQDMQGTAAAYKLLGLIPDTLNLQKFLVDLLTEQVVGFYDPGTKVLYIVAGTPPDIARVTVTHELVHALQDQYVDLDAVQRAIGDNDRQAAAQAVFEGQAVYEQLEAMLGTDNVAMNLPGGWDRIRQMIRDNAASMPVYASAPLIIQETLVFPYLSGAEFVKNYKEREHGGVPYANMPVSTAQIMHPQEFFDHRENPTPVSFAPTPGITRIYDNDLGEFETRVMLFQYLQNQDDATHGAMGWNGDRYLVFQTPGAPEGRGIAWATVWDTQEQAANFYQLMRRVIDARTEANPGRTMKVTTSEVSGRPVVLYVDVPKGQDPAMVSLQAVRLGVPSGKH